MIEAKERDIDGIRVNVLQWGARKALKNKFILGKLIGPAIGKLGKILGNLENMGDETDEVDLTKIDLGPIGDAFFHIMISLEENKFDKLLNMLMENVKLNEKTYNETLFDEIFTGNLMAVYKTISFVLEVNYKDFFVNSGIGNLLEKQVEKAKTTSQPISLKKLKKHS